MVIYIYMSKKTNTTFDNGNISAKDLYEYYNYRIFKDRFAVVESLEIIVERIIINKIKPNSYQKMSWV